MSHTKLSAPEPLTLHAFADLCEAEDLGTPHFVRLRQDCKRPCTPGWQKRPVKIAAAADALLNYDIGLIPASIGMVVIDNDTGGQAFFDHISKELGEAVVAITPSSSDQPGRGHIWIACEDPELVGAQRVRFNGEQVGDFRASNAQIRLTEKALNQLLDSDKFANAYLAPQTMAARLYDLTGSQPSLVEDIEMGDDRDQDLPEALDEQMRLEFNRSTDRSATIASWCWKLKGRGYAPVEIHRYLEDIDEVRDKVDEQGFDLKADVLRNCGKHEAARRTVMLTEFPDDLRDVFEDWVWITSKERFYRRSDGREFTDRQFQRHFQHRCPDITLLKEVWLGRTPIEKFEEAQYLPFGEERHGAIYNIWRPSDVIPLPGDTTPFDELMERMYPDESDRGIVLDYLHFLTCRPEVKLKFALVMLGRTGIGKSAIGALVTKIVGEHNERFPSNDEVRSRWTTWQEGCSLVFIEELMMNDRRDFADRMKTVITEPRLRIEAKNANLYTIPNRVNLLASTNHDNAVSIDSNDRRWAIVESPLAVSDPMTPAETAFYDRLWTFIESPGGPSAVLHNLKERSPKLNPNQRAPMTAAKARMIEASQPVWRHDLQAAWDDREGPFDGELFQFFDVKDFLSRRGHKVKRGDLSKALRDLGAVQHDRVKNKGAKTITLWSTRNHDRWAASPTLRKTTFERQAHLH